MRFTQAQLLLKVRDMPAYRCLTLTLNFKISPIRLSRTHVEIPDRADRSDRVARGCTHRREERHLAHVRASGRDVSQRFRGATSRLRHRGGKRGHMGGVADTRFAALHDDTLHPPPAQRENVYHVDIHVQVSFLFSIRGMGCDHLLFGIVTRHFCICYSIAWPSRVLVR